MPSQSIIPRLEKWMKKYRLPLMPMIWGVTCLIIGILIAVGLYSYTSAEKAMADQFNQQQLVLARQAAQGIESHLGNLRQTLTLLHAARRKKYGRMEPRIPSCFLEEIPPEILARSDSDTPGEPNEADQEKMAADFFAGIRQMLGD